MEPATASNRRIEEILESMDIVSGFAFDFTENGLIFVFKGIIIDAFGEDRIKVFTFSFDCNGINYVDKINELTNLIADRINSEK